MSVDQNSGNAGLCKLMFKRMMASPLTDLQVESIKLHSPSFEELAEVLKDGLSKNFAEVDVSVVECPDLRQHPWTLASPGICGNPRIADVGGPPYLIPTPKLHKLYSFDTIAETSELPRGFVIGAGAGSSYFAGVNCEMMANLVTCSGGTESIFTKTSKVCEKDGSCILENYKCGEFGLLGNFLISRGEPGRVLKVCASRRVGKANFVSCMRTTLGDRYGTNVVGMGGVFVIEKGKAKFHIMPRFSATPLHTEEDVNNWLKFYDMSSPLVCVGVFESYDPGLDLRVEHFHGFSHHGEGGHYHYDVTPEEVQYVGYFTPAEILYRIDKPNVTHNIGRDMKEDH